MEDEDQPQVTEALEAVEGLVAGVLREELQSRFRGRDEPRLARNAEPLGVAGSNPADG